VLVLMIASMCLGGCLLTTKIKNGEMAYDRKQYSVAVDMLTKEYDDTRNGAERARKAYLLGQSYTLMGETQESLTWLRRAHEAGYGNEASLALAYTYKKMGNYKAAIGMFDELLQNVKGRQAEITREINVCKQVLSWSPNDRYQYDIDLLRASSKDADYGAVVFEDEFLIFTSDREGTTGDEVYKWSGGYHSDLYIVNKRGGSARRFDAMINSKHNDGALCFSSDYSDIYFTRCYSDADDKDAHCKIMYSSQLDGVWSEPIPLDFVTDEYNYGQPALIEGDSVLIFSANLPESIGGKDLFYVEKIPTPDSSYYWSEPAPMPSRINTPGDELFAVGDGDTLYFSSNHHAGYGGLDIFKTYVDKSGTWAKPQNMLTPINSSEDDYSYVIDRTSPLRAPAVSTGYFTSSRKGLGYDDIYRWSKRVVTAVRDTIPADEPVDTKQYIINLVVSSRTPTYTVPDDPNSLSTGTKTLQGVDLTIYDGEGQANIVTDKDGRAILEAEAGKIYRIKASKNGYLNSSQSVSTVNLTYPDDQLSITINTTVVLDKIYYNKEIVLDNIYYDFNKWNIREDAQPTLDTLALLLLDNPQINIELSSHTDCRGYDDYNMILSQKRAQSVVDYLGTKKVPTTQVTPRGYGESLPNITCEECDLCSDDDHQKNRRTSFKIMQ